MKQSKKFRSTWRTQNGRFGLQHLVGALFLTIVAFILGLIGFGTPYWYYKSETGCTRYGGLWHTCTTIGLSTTCFDMVDSQEGK